MRTVIIGGPRTGKTTLANNLGEARAEGQLETLGPTVCQRAPRVRHTDDLIGRVAWSKDSEIIATQWFAEPGPWIIEGVTCARALRKWLRLCAATHAGNPCDQIIWLRTPHVDLTRGQAAMAKGVETVWLEIAEQVQARGVRVLDGAVML